MTSFAELAARSQAGPTNIPDGWKQGRTAYGGLTAALMLGHARAQAAPDADWPPLRSALINFTGPVSGAPDFASRPLRRGRNVTTVESHAGVDGQVVATACFSFGRARDSQLDVDRPGPDAPVPEDCPPLIPPAMASFAPAFTRNFECRLIQGERPVSGAQRGYLRAWARHADPASRAGEASLLCLADILPPAAMPMLTRPGPVSSMSWIFNLLRPPVSEGGWFMVEAEMSAVVGGYSSQVMRMWNADGQMVVEGMQSIVVFA